MKKYRTRLKDLLEPFSKTRRVVILVFIVLLFISSLLVLITIFSFPMMQETMPDAFEEISTPAGWAGVAVLGFWFISAMGVSISTNKASMVEAQERRRAVLEEVQRVKNR